MKCQSCGYPDSHVISSDRNEIKNLIKRRRECLRCGFRFTTEELLRVIKPMHDRPVSGTRK